MGQYQNLMEKINKGKRKLFEQLINKAISIEEFQAQCKDLEKELETEYLILMADKRMKLGSNEIWLDMGMQPNFS